MADDVFVLADALEQTLLKITNQDAPDWLTDVVVGLYQNNFTPTSDTNYSFGDLTIADFSGYADYPLSGTDWDTPSSGAIPSHMDCEAVPTFTRDSTGTAQTVYGWWIGNSGHTKLYAVARFSEGPFIFEFEGDRALIVELAIEAGQLP